MAYYAPWPGEDGPPVVYNVARPGRRRARLGSEGYVPRVRHQQYYAPNGELLVPASAGPAFRSNSVSGPRPQVNIVNEQVFDDYGRRPRSTHYHHDGDYYARSPSRSPMTEGDYETREKLRRLKELEEKEKEEKREKEIKAQLLLKKAKEDEEERERVKEHKELKKKAVEEWKTEELKKKEKEKEEKEKTDKEAEERMRKMLWANGYTDSQIDKMVKRSKKKKDDDNGEGSSHGGGGQILKLNRPTYLRIKRKYLDPETLNLYELPWAWDDDDNSYIIIKKWINERDQEILFEHTRKLRETKQLTYTTTALRKEHDQLLLVKKREPRKKSPARNWFLT